MSAETANVVTVSLDDAYVLMDDGEILPITNAMDEDGDDCPLADAVVIVAGRDGYGWLTITLGAAEESRSHIQ